MEKTCEECESGPANLLSRGQTKEENHKGKVSVIWQRSKGLKKQVKTLKEQEKSIYYYKNSNKSDVILLFFMFWIPKDLNIMKKGIRLVLLLLLYLLHKVFVMVCFYDTRFSTVHSS